MAKLVLNDISNITGNPTSAEQLINENFAAIEAAVENTLSRDGTVPNYLEASLDANSQRIVNLPYALSETEPVTLAQVMALVTGEDWTGGVGAPSVVFYQDNEPTATASGQVWVKTNGEFYIWNGTQWIKQVDPLVTYAVNQANTAYDTANTASSEVAGAVEDADAALAAANSVVDNLNLLSPRVLAVENDVANVQSAIIDLENEDIVLAGQIALVSADQDDLSAAVYEEQLARIQGDQALASSIQQIQVSNAPAIFIQASAPVAGVGGVPDPIVDGSVWYDSDDGNRQYRWLDNQWNDVTDAQIGTLYGLITTEQTARIDGDSVLAIDITALQVQRDNDYALIVSNNTARVNADLAMAGQIDGLTASFSNLQATVANESVVRANADSALASNINVVQASLNTTNSTLSSLSATVTTNNQARVDGDNALASSVSAVNTTVGGLSTTVSQHTSSIDGIQGKYTIKIDNNGYISGYGLVSSPNNGTPYATFTVLANAFRIVTPGATPIIPFQVVNGVTYIKDVRIDTATIGTATIGTTQIAPGAINSITDVNFTANATSQSSTTYISVPTAAVTVSSLDTNSKVLVTLAGIGKITQGYDSSSVNGMGFSPVNYRLIRNDGVVIGSIYPVQLSYFGVGTDMGTITYIPQTLSWIFVDKTPVSASHTYTLQVGTTYSWVAVNTKGTLVAQAAKR